MQRSKSLRDHDSKSWIDAETQIQANADAFGQILDLQFQMLKDAEKYVPNPRRGKFERGMRMLAGRSSHLLRAAWVSTACGYRGAYQPLIRALYETSLTMFYLRSFPGEFAIWMKENKTSEEERRFWPSGMLNKLKSPESERTIIAKLAEAAHATPQSLTGVASYDTTSNALQINIGGPVERTLLLALSANLCLFASLSTYTIARTLRGAITTGIPSDSELDDLVKKLDKIRPKTQERKPEDGVSIFELLRRQNE